MTRRAEALAGLCPQPLVEISAEDARRGEVADGARVRIASGRGEMLAAASITRPGCRTRRRLDS
jgi:predicted molibdopterin-dependent oxidoreductase YjgC